MSYSIIRYLDNPPFLIQYLQIFGVFNQVLIQISKAEHQQILALILTIIKLTGQIMIDGIYPSQFMGVEAMRTSHYRNLITIINKNTHNVSFPSPKFKQITRRKKVNHSNWKSFNSLKNEQQRFKSNYNLYERLQKISSSKSRYTIKTQQSPPKDALLHHNNFYDCYRRFQSIERNNPLIASRIIKAKADISHKKQEQEYKVNKFNVSRLQKFDRFKRMIRIANKSLNQKFLTSMPTIYKVRVNTIHSESVDNPEAQD